VRDWMGAVEAWRLIEECHQRFLATAQAKPRHQTKSS
jgi:hypothetical protein